jgi:phosphoribosyl-ATP pyrophosphohydrolase/phosphoribosyl-AMP cyclohydrolase
MKFEKLNYKNGLIPVITQDTEGKVLMLAYANRQALEKSMQSKKAYYWSRSRNKLWMKGDESGNTQEIIAIYTDCDKDSILYIVKQKGVACHKNTYSCFTERIYGNKKTSILEEVYQVIKQRIKEKPKESYVANITKNDKKLISKIREESEEFIEAFENDDNMIWEAADLLFHTFLILAKSGKEYSELLEEFRGRRK